MLGIRCRLGVLMTGDAGKSGIIGWIRVAISARSPLPGVRTAVNWEPRVIENRAAPSGGRVALRAVPWKSGADMSGINRAVVLL